MRERRPKSSHPLELTKTAGEKTGIQEQDTHDHSGQKILLSLASVKTCRNQIEQDGTPCLSGIC